MTGASPRPQAISSTMRLQLADPHHVLTDVPLMADIVANMPQVRREAVPDMPDRIVAATALHFGVPVISRDGRIRASNVQTVW